MRALLAPDYGVQSVASTAQSSAFSLASTSGSSGRPALSWNHATTSDEKHSFSSRAARPLRSSAMVQTGGRMSKTVVLTAFLFLGCQAREAVREGVGNPEVRAPYSGCATGVPASALPVFPGHDALHELIE